MFCLHFYQQYLTFWSFCYCKKQIDASFLSSVLLLMTLSKCYGSTSRRCQRRQFDVNLLITDRPIFLENGVQSSLLLKWIYYCWNLTQSWIGDSTPLIAYSRYWISVELGFWIPIVSGILDSLSCIPDSKTQDCGFHTPKFPEFRNPDSWKVGRLNLKAIPESLQRRNSRRVRREERLSRSRRLYRACRRETGLDSACAWTQKVLC